MHPARILLFTGGDPISLVVKWQTRSAYSHAAILLPDSNTVIESYPFAGVRKRTLTQKDWRRIHAFEVIGMSESQWRQAIAFAESRLGCGYDWRNVLRFVTRIPGRENRRWFCSELVHEAVASSFGRLLIKKSCEVDPGDLPASPLLRRDEALELAMHEFYSNDDD